LFIVEAIYNFENPVKIDTARDLYLHHHKVYDILKLNLHYICSLYIICEGIIELFRHNNPKRRNCTSCLKTYTRSFLQR